MIARTTDPKAQPMTRITVTTILAWHPCEKYSEEVIRQLFGRRKSVTVDDVLRAKIPPADRLWVVLREELVSAKTLQLFACACAERALKRERKVGREPNTRSWEVVATARRYVMGKARAAELSAAREAAWEAACSAARAAACSAARAADRKADRAADRKADRAAAREDELRWQVTSLLRLIRKPSRSRTQ